MVLYPARNEYLVMAKPSPTYSGHPTLVNFGNRARSIRISKSLSQESVALACGLDRSYYGGVERGEHNLSLINIERIAIALDVKIKDLV